MGGAHGRVRRRRGAVVAGDPGPAAQGGRAPGARRSAICLGAQLLAAAHGGQVEPAADGPEIGPALVAKRDAADDDPLFGPVPLMPGRGAVAPRRDHRAAAGAALLAASTRLPAPGVPGRRAGVGAAVPHRVDAGDGAPTGPRRPGPAGRRGLGRRRRAGPRDLDAVHADLEEVWQPFAARFAALVRARSPDPGIPRRPGGVIGWAGGDRPSGGCCGWPGSASPTPSGPAPCSGRHRTGSACGPAATRPTAARPRSSPRSAGPPTPTSRCARCPGSRRAGPARRAARRPGAAPPAGRRARRVRRARRPPGREPGGLAAADRPAGAAGPAPGGRRRPRRPADRHPRRPAGGTGEDVVADLRLAYRRHLLVLAARTWPARSASTRSARRWPRWPTRPCGRPRGRPGRSCRPGAPRPGSPSSRWASAAAGSSTTSPTSTSIFVADRRRRPVADHQLAARLMRICGQVRLAGRRGAAAGGQPRPAGPDARQPPGLLQAVGPDLGVPGAAQGPAGRRRPRPRARRTSRRWRRWCGRRPSGTDFVDDVQAMRRRVEDNVPPDARRPGDQARPGRAARRRVRRAAAAARARPGRRDAARRRARSTALRALVRGGYVGRDDGGDAGRRRTASCAPVEHRLQLQRLRRTHLLPGRRRGRRCAGWPARLGYGRDARRRRGRRCSRASGPRTPRRSAGCTRSCSTGRCCDAVARVPSDELRLSPEAAGAPAGGARLRRPGRRAAAPGGADRRGVAGGGDPADAAAGAAGRVRRRARTRTAGCWPTGRCPRRSATRPGTCGCCATRVRSPSGWPGCWAPSALRRRPARPGARRCCGCSPTTPSCAPRAGRRRCATAFARPPPRGTTTRPRRSRAARALRRHELLRIACADLLGLARRRPRSAQALDRRSVAAARRRRALDAAAARAVERAARADAGPVRGDRHGPARRRRAGLRLATPTCCSSTSRCPAADEQRGRRGRARGGRELRRLLGAPSPGPAAGGRRRPAPGGRAAGRWSAPSPSYRAYYARWSQVVGGAGAAAGPARRRRRRTSARGSSSWSTRSATRSAG